MGSRNSIIASSSISAKLLSSLSSHDGLGLCGAQICDKAIGSRELEQSIINMETAKRCLVHYNSMLDNLILKKNYRMKGSIKKVHSIKIYPSNFHESTMSGSIFPMSEKEPLDELLIENSLIEDRFCRNFLSCLWKQWHYDYGIFTILTTPLFTSPECSSPDGHTYLQLFDTKKNNLFVVKSPPESFFIQVGEAADILSCGKLCITLILLADLLKYSETSRKLLSSFETSGSCDQKNKNLQKSPLSSRLRDGMTLAEFSRETTRQYYSDSGPQSVS
ncbi:uncharacterized protein LOC103697315 [Phoenix dactylifera]|uniref:Uncharacterized protein LOC103697315 n=1 Tax=Phoenix dactylifera TaxID=42345 RepID=A0A8B8ZVI8_PHODC|nr:uncharacterized protein LOC103697315 [Phoenix dactylifera]